MSGERNLHNDAATGSLASLVLLKELQLAVIDGAASLLADEGDGVEWLHAILHECNCYQDWGTA